MSAKRHPSLKSLWRARWSLLGIVVVSVAGVGGERLHAEQTAAAVQGRLAARPVEVGGDLEALVEADWLAQAHRWAADRNQAGPVRAQRDAAGGVDANKTGFPLALTQDVLRRAGELAARLRPPADARRLEPLIGELDRLQQDLTRTAIDGRASEASRKDLYLAARRVLRSMAFANPLLGFDKLLFVKRHHPGGVHHICDQYYGFSAVGGGGLFVLEQPCSDAPRLVDLLGGAVCRNGRFQGRKLVPGSCIAPDVSFDGRSILFAYTQNSVAEPNVSEPRLVRQWTPENCYHVFRIESDGTGLTQLTDGPWDDFDPCWLPNGRIAFVSERRGGFVRCGVRACRSFSLCSMEADGSNIVPLSFHETNEWHPSVTNEGMLVYTRWDYIDRDTQCAHHLWLCYPDGRDPRAPHGNYPRQLRDRPWAELDIRAIPGSPRFVATAAPHHGHAFGSLVWIDLRRDDDGANAQVTRLTPEVPFPEGEGPIRESEVYGTAWPLSEDDYLCAYDASAQNHGIYWIDRFGNRELIYRDPAIPSLSPIPLAARVRPPVIPEQTTQTAQARKAAGGAGPATVAVMNVYDSDFVWPSGVRITALRILQVLPKSVPARNVPKIGAAEQSNARAVLGTVPVESDGSVLFEAPPGKLIYFQALDEDGLAVQSMRTATYLHPGERLTCQGCHEPRRRPPPAGNGTPLALRRPPSTIAPDVEGSNPFSYVRLVQPVLDRHCVACHQEKNALDLGGQVVYPLDRDRNRTVFTRSYLNLAPEYGFWFETLVNSLNTTGYHGGSRTTAGQFGARAARLTAYLDQRHYGVKLSDEEFHRLTLWLDCNSEFLGAYENADGQAHGEVVLPALQ